MIGLQKEGNVSSIPYARKILRRYPEECCQTFFWISDPHGQPYPCCEELKPIKQYNHSTVTFRTDLFGKTQLEFM